LYICGYNYKYTYVDKKFHLLYRHNHFYRYISMLVEYTYFCLCTKIGLINMDFHL